MDAGNFEINEEKSFMKLKIVFQQSLNDFIEMSLFGEGRDVEIFVFYRYAVKATVGFVLI